MSHDTEVSIFPILSVAYQAYRYTGKGTCSYDRKRKEYHNSAGGGFSYQGRCASQHTVKDANGWRPPTPYWGYEYKTVGYSPIGDPAWTLFYSSPDLWSTDKQNCPIVATRGLPMSSSELASYRPNFGDLKTQAITAALAELGSASAELGVELKEAHKTASFISDQLSLLVKGVKAIKNGRIPPEWKRSWRRWKSNAHSALDPAVQTWMEYRYAWSPMVLGVYDALDLLDKRKERPRIVTVRKRAESADRAESFQPSTSHGGYYPLACSRRIVDTVTKSAYVVVSFTPKEYFYLALNDAGVLNPAAVLWETIPLSFVVDWFANLGDYFNAQAALRLWSLKGGTVTFRQEWLTETTVEFKTELEAGYQWCVMPYSGTAIAGGHSFNRVVLGTGDLTPSVTINPSMNWRRCLDSAALMHGFTKGLFKGKSGLRL